MHHELCKASGSGGATQFAQALAEISEYTNTATGTVPGPDLPSGYYASSTEITTLADIIASCINSAGGTAADNTSCGQVFKLATPPSGTAPTDTVTAVANIINNANQNVSAIFNLLLPSAPFQPALTAAPANWELPIVPIAAIPVITRQPALTWDRRPLRSAAHRPRHHYGQLHLHRSGDRDGQPGRNRYRVPHQLVAGQGNLAGRHHRRQFQTKPHSRHGGTGWRSYGLVQQQQPQRGDGDPQHLRSRGIQGRHPDCCTGRGWPGYDEHHRLRPTTPRM